jgi:glycosyltransferase involved in cell wall biosynthesis
VSKLSIIVPIYNEAPRLEAVLSRIMSTPCPIEREWIFVDDYSTDGSLDILKSYPIEEPTIILEQSRNQGKGAAIIRALAHTTGDFVLIQDADLEYDPSDIPQLLEPLLQNRADAVFGSRFKKNSPYVHRTYHYFVNRILTLLSNMLSGIYLTDMETCYKIFRADLVKSMRLKSRRFGIEVELTAYIAKTKARVQELPIAYYPRFHLQGKKINWRDGVAALFHLVRFNCLVRLADAFVDLPEEYLPLQKHGPLLLLQRTTPLN